MKVYLGSIDFISQMVILKNQANISSKNLIVVYGENTT